MKKSITLFSIVLSILFFSLTNNSFSQEVRSKHPKETTKASASGNEQLKAKASTNSNVTTNVQPRVDTQGKSFQVDENDAYQGRTEEFLSQITLKELPKDFPKYEKWMGVRHYNEVISDYYKKHLDILIPSVKQKLTQIH